MARKRPESELVRALHETTGLGYRQCEWISDNRRCLYPGSISTNTHEGGPWYCGLHFQCDSASFGATVVDASRDYRHPTPEEMEAEHLERAKASLKARGLDRRPDETVRQWVHRTARTIGEPKFKKFEDAA